MREITSKKLFYPKTLDALKAKVQSLYQKAFDKLKSWNRFHAAIGALVSALVLVGGIAMVCTGFGAYMGKALIQTGINGITYCIQAAIAGKFSWADFAIEQGASFVSACLFPYVESLGGKMLLQTALTYIKDGFKSLITGKEFDLMQTTKSAIIGIATLGIQESLGINQLLYGQEVKMDASQILSASLLRTFAINFTKGAISSAASNILGQALNTLVSYKEIRFEDFRRNFIEQTYVEDLSHIEKVWIELKDKQFVVQGRITDKAINVLRQDSSTFGLSSKLNVYEDIVKSVLTQFSQIAKFDWSQFAISTLSGAAAASITSTAQLKGQKNEIKVLIKLRINDIQQGKGSNSVSLKVLSNIDEVALTLENEKQETLFKNGQSSQREVKIQFDQDHYLPYGEDGRVELILGKEGDCAFDAYGKASKQAVEDVKVKVINALLQDPVIALKGVQLDELRIPKFQGGSPGSYAFRKFQEDELSIRHKMILMHCREREDGFFEAKYDNGIYTFQMEREQLRVTEASREFTLSDLNKGTKTNKLMREIIKKMGQRTDHAGHIFANRHGGTGEHPINLFPQNGSVNSGAFRVIERNLTQALKTAGQGHKATVNIKFQYEGPQILRPSSYQYEMKVLNQQGRQVNGVKGSFQNPYVYR